MMGSQTGDGRQIVSSASRPMRQASRLDLHIDELALQGFPDMDGEVLGAAVQGELARLLEEGGVPSRLGRGGQVDRVDGGAFTVEAGADVRRLGAQIARTVYGGLGR